MHSHLRPVQCATLSIHLFILNNPTSHQYTVDRLKTPQAAYLKYQAFFFKTSGILFKCRWLRFMCWCVYVGKRYLQVLDLLKKHNFCVSCYNLCRLMVKTFLWDSIKYISMMPRFLRLSLLKITTDSQKHQIII